MRHFTYFLRVGIPHGARRQLAAGVLSLQLASPAAYGWVFLALLWVPVLGLGVYI